MATATQTPSQNDQATVSGNTSAVREDVVVGKEQYKDKEGKISSEPVRYSADQVNDAKFKEEHPTFQEAYRVTTSMSKPLNVAGIKEVAGDNEEEAGRLFFNGAQQKVNNRMNKFLLDTDEQGNFIYAAVIQGQAEDKTDTWNGSYVDLDQVVRSESLRKTLTEEEKMIKSLSMLPDAVALVTFNAWRTATGRDPVAQFPRK